MFNYFKFAKRALGALSALPYAEAHSASRWCNLICKAVASRIRGGTHPPDGATPCYSSLHSAIFSSFGTQLPMFLPMIIFFNYSVMKIWRNWAWRGPKIAEWKRPEVSLTHLKQCNIPEGHGRCDYIIILPTNFQNTELLKVSTAPGEIHLQDTSDAKKPGKRTPASTSTIRRPITVLFCHTRRLDIHWFSLGCSMQDYHQLYIVGTLLRLVFHQETLRFMWASSGWNDIPNCSLKCMNKKICMYIYHWIITCSPKLALSVLMWFNIESMC